MRKTRWWRRQRLRWTLDAVVAAALLGAAFWFGMQHGPARTFTHTLYWAPDSQRDSGWAVVQDYWSVE